MSIVILLVLIIVAVQIPYVQNKIKNVAITFVQDKIGTKVELDRVEIAFPKKIVIKGLYLESQQNDTLIYTKYLGVDIGLFKLLNNTVDVSSVELEGFKTNVKRDSLQRFNFDYIIEAFASDDDKEESDSAPMRIDVGQISLKDIQVKFDDQYEGHHLDFKLNSFITRFKDFDLDDMKFAIPKVGIDGLVVDYQKALSLKPISEITDSNVSDSTEESSALPKLQLGTIEFKNFNVSYKDDESKMSASLLLGHFMTSFDTIDLDGQQIDIKEIKLLDTKGQVRLAQVSSDSKPTVEIKEESKENEQQEKETEDTAKPWRIGIKDFVLKKIDIQFDNESEKALAEGLDANHIKVENLNFRLKDFQFSPNTITGNLAGFSFKEKSGFELANFKTYFLYSEQSSFIKDFLIETPHTKVKSSIVLNYRDINKIKEQLADISLDVSVFDSHIGLKDIDILMPSIWKQNNLPNLKNETVSLGIKSKGVVSDLTIEEFFIKGFKSTVLNVNGKVKGLPDVEKAYVNLNLKQAQTSARDITLLAPKNTIPSNIEIPQNIFLKGFVSGTMKDIGTQMELKTSLGNVSLLAKLDQKKKGKEAYELDFKVNELNVGRLIKNDSIGIVTLSAKAKGTSFIPETANGVASFEVEKVEYNKYTYNNVKLEAALNDGEYYIKSVNKDPYLTFDIDAKGLWTKENISLKLLANFHNIDLYKLNIENEPSVFSTIIDADMANILPDSLVGKLQIRDFGFATLKSSYNLSPITVEASAKNNYRKISLSSQLADFEMEGDYRLTELAGAMEESLQHYFKKDSEDDKHETATKENTKENKRNQYFSYDLRIKYDKVYVDILPELKVLEPIRFSGKYDQSAHYLSLQGGISNIEYGENKIENVTWNIQPANNALTYQFDVASISNATIRLRRVDLKGFAKDNILTYNLNLKDKENKICYLIAGELEAKEKELTARLLTDGFIMDYVKWGVHPDNRIVVGEKGIYVRDFEIKDNNSGIAISSEEEVFNSPLHIKFNDFKIETLTRMVKKDKELASGSINGYVSLVDLSKDFRFISSLDINSLTVFENLLGNLHIGVKNETLSKYLALVSLEGGPNRIVVKGTADVDQEDLNMNVNVEKLELKSLERFTMENLSNAEGHFSGNIDITGKFTQPSILGDFKFNNIGFHVNPINADFKNINEKILFTNRGIEFDKFSITDSYGNLLVFDGQILTKTYTDFAFNLGITALDFTAINSTSKDNDMYYGKLVFDSNIKIKGNMNTPIVSGGLAINKKTNFTIVMPQEDPSIADREGIVEFIDEESIRLAELQKYQDNFNNSDLKGLNVSLAIKVDKEATFSMIMDKVSGDKVTIKGEGDIMGGIDPSGQVTLTGRYEFYEGSYDLSFNMLKRKFEIQKGSSIIFAGEPTDAILNMTAIYQVNTAPLDLLQGQLTQLSPTQQNMYKQKIPFQALLMMKGELLKPEISFNIQLKDGITSVSGDVINNTNTKLAQLRTNESEMNKQVFALLLLNRFIGENPFENSAGGMSAGAIARQSVNQFLSDQLNNLASSLISGVELNFNLDSSEDFSSGTRENRTDLNVAVSKRLFSDRLKVTVGSNFEVEGSQRENEQAANIAGDIEIEYALSQDGRYLLRAYRKNRYEVALQGQIIETGVGFVITMSYENFRELFERSKDKRQLKKQLRNESKKEL